MKDWKAEYDKLRGETAELRKQLDYERQNRERREVMAEEVRDNSKNCLLTFLVVETNFVER